MSRQYSDPDIRKICSSSGLDYNNTLINSLYWRNDTYIYLWSCYKRASRYINNDVYSYINKMDTLLNSRINAFFSFLDILAAVIYYCETGIADSNNLYFSNLSKELKSKGIINNQDIDNIQNREDYKYLHAFNNYSKHRGIIDLKFIILSLNKEVKYSNEIVYKEFSYKDEVFESKCISDIDIMLINTRESIKSIFKVWKKTKL